MVKHGYLIIIEPLLLLVGAITLESIIMLLTHIMEIAMEDMELMAEVIQIVIGWPEDTNQDNKDTGIQQLDTMKIHFDT